MTVSINEVSKYFSKQTGTVQVLENINFQLEKGDFVTVIGAVVVEKYIIKIIAGLDNDFEGEIIIDGERITKPSKKQGFIFQEHRLFPWLTVEENIAADLSLKDKYVKDKVKEWVKIVRLDGFEKSYPKEISGGMSQRVAIARALLRDLMYYYLMNHLEHWMHLPEVICKKYCSTFGNKKDDNDIRYT